MVFLRKFRLKNFKMAAILIIYRNGTMLSILSHHVSPDCSQQGLVLLNSTNIKKNQDVCHGHQRFNLDARADQF